MTIRERLFGLLVQSDHTDKELAEALNLPRPSVRRYRRELQLAGRIEPCGDTDSGAVIWQAVLKRETSCQVVCPLCTGRGWILRAPTAPPIPFQALDE